ncbi:MAG: DUF3472 domain-containing protein [Bacteroidales bacterium]|nr:DUF3472 domain-containing protein [Bacteroidales bacterium]
MLKKFLTVIAVLIMCAPELILIAQNRAPSVYLDYKDNYTGDIIMNTLRVQSPAPLYTYYNSMCFGGGVDGGGYCGMQCASGGNNFIFSLWDPTSVKQAITADYVGDGTDIANFGGEGTGLRSLNYKVGWETGQWYTLVARVWSLNTHSHYGFWVFDHTKNCWNHLVTMNYPVDNLKFKNKTSAFIEDWSGNGWLSREIHRKEGWKRRTSLQWVSFSQATITRISPDAGCANYIDNYDGGVVNGDYYFIKSGGASTHPVNVSGTTISLPNSKTQPDFPAGEISNLVATNFPTRVILRWTVNSATSPQYSYTVEVFDNAGFTGTPLKSVTVIQPHARWAEFATNDLPSGTYFYRLFIHDIFDNRSNDLTSSFTGINDIPDYPGITIMPNPATDHLYIDGFSGQVEISVYDLTGHLLINRQATGNQINISSFRSGIYTIKIETRKGIITKRFVKQ